MIDWDKPVEVSMTSGETWDQAIRTTTHWPYYDQKIIKHEVVVGSSKYAKIIFDNEGNPCDEHLRSICLIRNVSGMSEKKVLKGWINIYPHGVTDIFLKEEVAKMCAKGNIATKYVEIEYYEGEGL